MITVKTSLKKHSITIHQSLLSLVSRDFFDLNTSQTIQDTLKDNSFFTPELLNWSIFRDMLCDITQLSHSNTSSLNYSPIKHKRIETSTKFSNSVKFNILANSSELISPMVRNSFILQTSTDRYTLIASNKYLMWNWILTIKKFYLLYLQRNRDVLSNSSVESRNRSAALRILYQYHHHKDHQLLIQDLEGDNSSRYFEGTLILHSIGLSITCQCTLDSRTMILSCQDKSSSEPPIQLSLVHLYSISISREFTTHQPFDVKLTCVSARLSVTALAAAMKRGNNAKEFEVTPIESKLIQEPSAVGWHPGRILLEGTKLTTSVVKTVVKGTLDGTTTIAKGTAGLATSAAESLVSIPIAAIGLSLQHEEITTTCVVNLPFAPKISTQPIVGVSPYWDSSSIIKLDRETLHESNSFGVSEGPCGIMVHILTKNKSDQTELFVGSKFLPYTDILPKDSLSFVDDHSLNTRGGLESNLLESTLALDTDIAFRIDVIQARNLLPPPRSNTINTILTHPLDSFVKLSTLATSTVGLTSMTDGGTDRHPRVTCSFVMWKGTPVPNGKSYR
jgi:hypothetical protein